MPRHLPTPPPWMDASACAKLVAVRPAKMEPNIFRAALATGRAAAPAPALPAAVLMAGLMFLCSRWSSVTVLVNLAYVSNG
jgi:hypothetical protein